jgi:hypothetical protein
MNDLYVPKTPGRARSRAIVSNKKKKIFLKCLAETAKVGYSAQMAGFANATYLRTLYNKDPEFRKEWDAALESGMDAISDEAVRRAVDGVREPVFYQGEVVGYKINYSDGLLMFLLKGGRPHIYKDSAVNIHNEVNQNIGVAVLPMTAQNTELWEERAARITAEQQLMTNRPLLEQKKDGSTVLVRK